MDSEYSGNTIGKISGTTNNSSYASFADQEGSISQVSSSNTSTTTNPSTLVDVTDTSNVKVKFGVSGAAGPISVKGNTSYNYTFFTFILIINCNLTLLFKSILIYKLMC